MATITLATITPPDPRVGAHFLVAIAVGDAYCAATEFVEANEPVVDKALAFEDYQQNPRYPDLKPGRYTDDTQMTIAVAETLAAGDARVGGRFDAKLADSFVRVFRRDPRDGYARRFQKLMNEVADGHELMTRLHGNNFSDKAGAAMRAVPLGICDSIPELMGRAHANASVTHNTVPGVASSQAVALMAHFARYKDDPFYTAPKFVARQLSEPYARIVQLPYEDRVAELVNGHRPGDRDGAAVGMGLLTVRAALTVLGKVDVTRDDVMQQALALIIKQGGDTDTVAAIVCGVLALRGHPITPAWLEKRLENGRYGTDYLHSLGARLLASPAAYP